MSAREAHIYKQMVAADVRQVEQLRQDAKKAAIKAIVNTERLTPEQAIQLERLTLEQVIRRGGSATKGISIPAPIVTPPIETMFFLPPKPDVEIARKWQRHLGDRPNHEMAALALFTAIRLIAQGTAVPMASLDLLREFDRDRTQI